MGTETYTFRVLAARGRQHDLRLSHTARRSYARHMDQSTHKIETGRRLRVAREQAGLTQEQAAEQLGNMSGEPCPPSRLGNWEQGTRLINPVALQLLSKIYGVSPSTIYGFEDAPTGADEIKLLEIYRSTDDRGKRAIHGVAEAQPAYTVLKDDTKKAS